MPSKMFYSSTAAEVLIVCKACNVYESFVKDSHLLIKRMAKQGASLDRLAVALKNIFTKHNIHFVKFNIPQEIMLDNILKGS